MDNAAEALPRLFELAERNGVKILEVTFLSGAFYPVKTMPEWMQWLAKVNPLTYAVDGSRYYLAGVEPAFGIATDWVVLAGFAALFAEIAALGFRNATID